MDIKNPLAGMFEELAKMKLDFRLNIPSTESLLPKQGKPIEFNSPFDEIRRMFFMQDCKMDAILSLLTQQQIDLFPKVYADILAERQLSIASSNKEEKKNP